MVALPLALGLLFAVPVGAYTASQVVAHVAASSGNGAAQLIGRADLHLDNTSVELSVSITQTESTCQAPLNGQYCLRYSMAVDEKPVQTGYGLIPNGDVDFRGSSISIDVDTSTSRFHHIVGSGGPISVTWTWQPGATPVTSANQTSTLSPATVQGTVLGQALTGSGLVASVLLYNS
jgi:hypothetical protein